MSHPKIGRRHALTLLAASGGVALVGCGGGGDTLRCDDVSGLSAADADFRRGQGYVERSTRPGRACDTCNFYTAGAPSACGECTLIHGPINPAGYCNLWVQRA
jgi:hypothetical protein